MRTVLLIDDDPALRAFLSELLQREGWEVQQARNGQEGLQLANQRPFEAVLCDLLMAPLNGFQVCRALREMGPNRPRRVIVISGRDFQPDRQAALEAGADDYLTKPLEPSRLLAILAGPSQAGRPVPAATQVAEVAMQLKFWGVRGSVPTPGPTTLQYGGNTSCVEVRAAGKIIILDAGTGLRGLGQELLSEFGEQPLDLVLLLSHTHWDHIQGLPFFKPVYKTQNRLRILGYEGARQGLQSVLYSQMAAPFFPVALREVPANITIDELTDLEFQIGEVQVQAAFANHPGISVGYRLSAGGRSITFFPDNELRGADENAPAADPRVQFAREENRKLEEFVRGTDVLIMDTQYTLEEYREHRGWGHGCLDSVVQLALDAGVGHLFLFHHDPEHEDAAVEAMTVRARQLVTAQKGKLKVEAAREGLVLQLSAFQPSPQCGL